MYENKVIVCGEHWCDEYQWWHPNTYPVDWLNRRNGIDSDDWGYEVWSFGARNVNHKFPITARMDRACSLDNSFKVDEIQRSPFVTLFYDEIPADRKYFYVIRMEGRNFYPRLIEHKFNYVNPKIVEDIKSGRAYVILLDTAEGYVTEKLFNELEDTFKSIGFNSKQVYFFHGNYKLRESEIITYIPCIEMLSWLHDTYDDILPFEPVDEKNIYLSYNRKVATHRAKIVIELHKNNLTDRGLWSYGGNQTFHVRHDHTRIYETLGYLQKSRDAYNINHPDYVFLSNEDESIARYLDENSPFTLDRPITLSDNDNPVHTLGDLNHYKQTFLSLVTETLWTNDSVFFSEKTAKPINVGHPFIVVATPGHLRMLKDYGFQTFDKWIDESYDDEIYLDKRLEIIISNIKRFSQYTIDELKQIRTEMEPVLRHNQKRFNDIRLTKEVNITEVLKKFMCKLETK